LDEKRPGIPVRKVPNVENRSYFSIDVAISNQVFMQTILPEN